MARLHARYSAYLRTSGLVHILRWAFFTRIVVDTFFLDTGSYSLVVDEYGMSLYSHPKNVKHAGAAIAARSAVFPRFGKLA